jgi:polyhydroxyalkanoic acid synthase PhaR subunit
MMEEVHTRLLAGVELPADPFTFFKQWYDATSETWSTVAGDFIGTEQFMQMSSEFLKSYISFYATMRRTNEAYFRNLQLPTRSDIARVAELVVNLEDKVDGLDSALEDFEDGIGSSLGHFPVVLQKLEAVESIEQRVGGLEKRLARVESKLDALLAAIEKLDSSKPAQAAKPAETTRRRAHKSKAELQQASDAEAQIES